ncbi:MAG: HEPN domain-containing protein [Paludibacteraceae bacterium]|nr:HEPN domain-containing protein [Paludibacteraceae bacterium]
MSLSQDERNILVELEIEKAIKTFSEISVLQQAELWDTIANRLYYASFHIVVALLIKNGYTVGTHQGAVIQLQQYFIKTGLLPKEYGTFYSQLQSLRENSDYNCTYYASKDDIIPRVAKTKEFIDNILALIKNQDN